MVWSPLSSWPVDTTNTEAARHQALAFAEPRHGLTRNRANPNRAEMLSSPPTDISASLAQQGLRNASPQLTPGTVSSVVRAHACPGMGAGQPLLLRRAGAAPD